MKSSPTANPPPARPLRASAKPWPFGASVFAPMEGVSHPTLRALMIERGGLSLVCTEFVRVTSTPLSARHLTEQVVRHRDCPLSVQVMGNDAARMAEAATIVASAGADVVDINLGCPMPKVVRKGVGAAMLKDLNLLQRVLAAMRRATPCLLSAKIRAGFDDSEQVLAIARVIEGEGADFITVHPRRRSDFYRGVADWRIIAHLKAELSIPVVGNGDVWYATDALRMQEETGCDAVMIGRPALRNLFIFQQIEQLRQGATALRPDGSMLLATLLHIFERYQQHYVASKRGPIGPIKELLSWVTKCVDDEGDLARAVLRKDSMHAIVEVLHQRLPALTARQLDLQPDGDLRLHRSGSAIAEQLTRGAA